MSSVPVHGVDRQGPKVARATGSVNAGQFSLYRMLPGSIERTAESVGGYKNLQDYFDGREGEAVSPSTISKWKSDPARCPAWALFTFVELDPVFRGQILELLLGRLAAPQELIAHLAKEDPTTAAKVASAQEELLRRVVFGPGGMGEHY